MIRLVQMSQHNPIAASKLSLFQVGIASLSWSRTYPKLWPLSHMVSKHILMLSSSFHSGVAGSGKVVRGIVLARS